MEINNSTVVPEHKQKENCLVVECNFMSSSLTDNHIISISDIIFDNYIQGHRIVFDFSSEGLPLWVLMPVNKIVNKLLCRGIKKEVITLLSASPSSELNLNYYKLHCKKFNLVELNIEFTNMFKQHFMDKVRWDLGFYESINTEPRIKSKKFLCYNRAVKPHRLFITSEIMSRGLLSHSYLSMYANASQELVPDLNTSIPWGLLETYFTTDITTTLKNNLDYFPIELSLHKVNDSDPHSIKNDIEYFNDSYFSLVTESKCLSDRLIGDVTNELTMDSVFLTEKTYKPIIAKHPFIIVSMPNSLKVLNVMGFKTFHPFIDETYDSIEDDESRLLLIMDEVQRLCNNTDEEWLEFQQNIKHIVEHNFRVMQYPN